MPLFKKPSFKANRKIPDRRIDAGATNTQLLDRQSLDPGVDYDENPVGLRLGEKNFIFSEGQWVCEGWLIFLLSILYTLVKIDGSIYA